MPRPLPALLAAALVALLLTACESKVTLDNYNQINPGMTLAEVEQILGPGTEEASHGGHNIGGSGLMSGASSNPDRIYIWEDGARKIILVFADGKVVTKNQSGLD